jgi:hypothetical protein
MGRHDDQVGIRFGSHASDYGRGPAFAEHRDGVNASPTQALGRLDERGLRLAAFERRTLGRAKLWIGQSEVEPIVVRQMRPYQHKPYCSDAGQLRA